MRYTYYTAGSGGVGPTILETSFLLAGTDVVVYSNGEKVALACCRIFSCSSCMGLLLSQCKGRLDVKRSLGPYVHVKPTRALKLQA